MQLMLLRHAKSSWADPQHRDWERPLNARGVREATQLGVWLAEQELWPDLVLCSAAQRTRQTWARVAEGGGRVAEIEVLEALYGADEATLWETIGPWARAQGLILVLGHNPGISDLASRLSGRQIDLKTGCLAHFRCLRPSAEIWRRPPGPAAWTLERTGCPGRSPA